MFACGCFYSKKKKGFTLLYSFFLFFGIDAPSELKKLTDSYGNYEYSATPPLPLLHSLVYVSDNHLF